MYLNYGYPIFFFFFFFLLHSITLYFEISSYPLSDFLDIKKIKFWISFNQIIDLIVDIIKLNFGYPKW